MEKQVYRFNNDIDTLEVSSMGAKITLKPGDGDEIYAEYINPRSSPEFCAVLSGKTLTFKEKLTLSLFCAKPEEEYSINVTVPRRTFAMIKINTASGGADIEGVCAQSFQLNTASGDIKVNAFFEDVKLQSASGSIKLTNPEKTTAKKLSLCSVSGSTEIVGYKAEEFSLHTVSGSVKYCGAAGKGKIAVTSGKTEVSYAEWNDSLAISAISGNITVSLPEGSGMDLKFDGASGSLLTDLGTEKGKFMNLGKGTSGIFGGENCHPVKVSLTSGKVTVCAE